MTTIVVSSCVLRVESQAAWKTVSQGKTQSEKKITVLHNMECLRAEPNLISIIWSLQFRPIWSALGQGPALSQKVAGNLVTGLWRESRSLEKQHGNHALGTFHIQCIVSV